MSTSTTDIKEFILPSRINKQNAISVIKRYIDFRKSTEAHYSQSQFSKDFNIDLSYLNKVLKGHRTIGDKVLSIAQALK